jgi:uncharacterized membrane protein YdbT with pleckstrin-like domain
MKTELTTGETLLLSTHKSLRSFIFDFVLLLVFGFMLTKVRIPIEYSGIVIFLLAAYQILMIINYKIYITSKRVITETGLFSQNLGETMIDKINHINSKKNFLGSILNYGTVEIETSANEKVKLDDIAKVNDLKGLINKARSEMM